MAVKIGVIHRLESHLGVSAIVPAVKLYSRMMTYGLRLGQLIRDWEARRVRNTHKFHCAVVQ